MKKHSQISIADLLVAVSLLMGIMTTAAVAQTGNSVTQGMLTEAERSNYERTSTFADVISVLDAIDENTDLMHRERLLISDGGREVPIVVLANPRVTSPAEAVSSGKPVIYIQGNIHGGEVEGKEASLIAMRDILFGDKQHLLENQILVFVPIYNADGNDAMSADSRPNQEMSPLLAGERTAHGYDLNRDGMAIEAAETAALYENVIQRWDPDLLVDLHTTNGTWHGYSLTYAPSYQTAGDGTTSAYTADVMLPALRDSIKAKFDLDFNWYGGFDYRDWPPTELRTYNHAPRYLTNNMGLRNRMAILSETFSHDRFYKRVHAANVFVEEILEYSNIHGQEIRQINRDADQRVIEKIRQQGGGFENGVRFEMRPLEEPLDLLSYKYIPYTNNAGETDFVRSSELVVIEGVKNFNRFEAIEFATVPRAYVFPASYSHIADKLMQHGISVETLDEEASYDGELFIINEISTQSFPLNGHQNSVLEGEFSAAQREFSSGDFYVPMDNRLANLIFYLLEPRSDDGLAFWNYFDEQLEPQFVNNGSTTVEYPIFKVLQ